MPHNFVPICEEKFKSKTSFLSQINVCRIITTTSGSDGRQATKPTVIGTADVDVGGLLQLSDKSFLDKRYEYTGNIPVVAAHSLRTPRDGQRQPAVNVFMAVAPDAELTAARFRPSGTKF